MAERRPIRTGPVVLIVGLLIALRVLGISALMPVLSPYGFTLSDDAVLVGLAFGGYGLTMALMQLPMGALSDRIGRRRTIVLGLGLYITGNIIAWQADTIEWLIVGRLVEGVGAISSVALALLADVVPEERRTMSIAVAGIGAGLAFLLGVSLGPLIALAIGVPGIFLASAIAGALAIGGVLTILPSDAALPAKAPADRSIAHTLFERRALSADLAGFVMNTTLTATMFALPLLLVGGAGAEGDWTEGAYRRLLLVSVLIGGILSIGAARAADKRGAVPQTATLAALLIGGGSATLLLVEAPWMLYLLATLYFAGHGAQSAALPSLLGSLVGPARRGAAMGGYNAWTFFGSFVGGMLGAALYARGVLLPVVLLGLGLVAFVALAGAGRQRTTPASAAA